MTTIYERLEEYLKNLKNGQIIETFATLEDSLCSTLWMKSCAIKKNNKIIYILISDENRGGPEKISKDDFLDFCENHEFKSRNESMTLEIEEPKKFNMKEFMHDNYDEQELRLLLNK